MPVLNSAWFAGVPEKEKEELEKRLFASATALKALEAILTRRLEERDRKGIALESYKEGNWAYIQADLVGAKRELRFILDLLKPITGPQ